MSKKKIHWKKLNMLQKEWKVAKNGDIEDRFLREKLSSEYDMEKSWLHLLQSSSNKKEVNTFIVDIEPPEIEIEERKKSECNCSAIVEAIDRLVQAVREINIKKETPTVPQDKKKNEAPSIYEPEKFKAYMDAKTKIKYQIMYDSWGILQRYGQFDSEELANEKAKLMWFRDYSISKIKVM